MSLLPPGLHQILQQQVTSGIAPGKVDLYWASQIDIELQLMSSTSSQDNQSILDI